jgi:hypothetical protein
VLIGPLGLVNPAENLGRHNQAMLPHGKHTKLMGTPTIRRRKTKRVVSHLISEEEPSASHMCARISSHTYDRQK